MSYGLENVATPDTAKYSLGEFNVDKLLQVSAYVPRQLASVDSAPLRPSSTGRTDASGRFSLIEPSSS